MADDLRRAAALFDGPDPTLRRAAAGVRTFAGGAEWMRLALTLLRRGRRPTGRADFHRLGTVKYATATLAAIPASVACIPHAWPLAMIAGPAAFYAVEAQAAFLFPVALDGNPRPFRASFQWTGRAGGTVTVVAGVLPIAATMLLGGLLGRGFVRSWCVGCLAVCLWYERVRRQPARRSRLEIGCRRPLLIRTVAVPIGRPMRLLYASDLHLGRPWTAGVPEQLLAAVAQTSPDVVLLGGDLSDVPAGLPILSDLVRRLAVGRPVLAVAGNHDRRPDRARRAVRHGGGTWLAGVRHVAGVGFTDDDQPADVLCAHDPAQFPTARATVTLAGHLHGGQCVLWTTPAGRLWPGCWVNRWTGLRFARNGRHLVVSRGCGDTLPVRFNCPREVLLIDLT